MTKIIYKHGNVFAGPEWFLAHGCNDRGVMGSGVAKGVRALWPKAYEFYRWNYMRQGLKVGDVYGIDCETKYILNCITQNGYGRDGKQYVSYDGVKECVLQMNKIVKFEPTLEPDNLTIAMPKIGSSLGGGDWDIIEKIIEDNSTFQPVVYIYE